MTKYRVLLVAGLSVAGTVAGVVPAGADSVEVYEDAHTPNGNGPAVSVFGCATSNYGLLAVSGTGCADSAGVAVSGTGQAGYRNPTCGYSCGGQLAVSGTDCARSYNTAVGGRCSEGGLAVSGTGDAQGYDRWAPLAMAGWLAPEPPGTAVSVVGDASAPTAASAFGDAHSRPAMVWASAMWVPYPGVAVSGTGDTDG